MGKYKNILVAVDGSVSSRNAFRQACRISRENGKHIAAVTVIPTLDDLFDSLSVREKAARAVREEGEKVLAEVTRAAEEEGVFLKAFLEEGSPYDAVNEVAGSGRYDLIVMGRRGTKSLERAFVGSVTARVIGHSAVDVLVIQRNTALGWKKILLATDGSKYSSVAADKAIDLAKSYGGELAIVSVVDVNEEFQATAPEAVEKMVKKSREIVHAIKDKAEAAGVKAEAFVGEGDSHSVIINLANEQNSNLIVMGSHGRSGLGRLLMGSVTEKVIGHTACPVLVVKS